MQGVQWPAVRSLLISPEFEGIKTGKPVHCGLQESLLISPEFEGIKTCGHGLLSGLCRY